MLITDFSNLLSALDSFQGIYEIQINLIAKGILILYLFAWIFGHSGIRGNTVTDQASKKAALWIPVPNLLLFRCLTSKQSLNQKLKDSGNTRDVYKRQE